MDTLCPGSTWSAFGVGHSAISLHHHRWAAISRVGVEDNVAYHAKNHAGRPTTASSAKNRPRRYIEEYGKEVATPAEAREILGLK